MTVIDLINENTYISSYVNIVEDPTIYCSKRLDMYDKIEGCIHSIRLNHNQIIIWVSSNIDDWFDRSFVILNSPWIEIIKEIYERVRSTGKTHIKEYVMKCKPSAISSNGKIWLMSIVLGANG